MARTTPTISIILPVKNGMPHLEECLDSIVGQTFDDWELIAVNDHSQDSTTELLHAYEQKDDRIHLKHSSEHGILPAMDLGFRNSRAPIISRMDADDIMRPSKLSSMLEVLRHNGPGHVITSKIEYIATGKELEGGYKRYQQWINDRCEQSDHYTHIYEECVLPSPNWMVHRRDLNRVKPFSKQQYPEDYDLCFQYYAHGLEIVPIDEVLHIWRDHPTRNTRTNPIYSDPTYFEIKTDYFLQLERDERPLLLYGAGVKGKKLARLWIDRNIDFHWTCSTQSKWGHIIYGKEIHSVPDIAFEEMQTVIAISAPDGRAQVDGEMRNRTLDKMEDFIHFC